jgi:hypothetical protein
MMRRGGQGRVRDMVLLGGWLFADLLLGLMMIFLISIKGGTLPPPTIPPGCGTPTATPLVATATQLSGTNGQTGYVAGNASKPTPTPTVCPTFTPTFTPTPTQTPTNCGLDNRPPVDLPHITVSNIGALESGDSTAQANFNAQVKAAFAAYPNKIAGLVEIFGGDPNVNVGQQVAKGAQAAMQQLKNGSVTFFNQSTQFQPFGDEGISSGQVLLSVFFYNTAANGQCQLSPP